MSRWSKGPAVLTCPSCGVRYRRSLGYEVRWAMHAFYCWQEDR